MSNESESLGNIASIASSASQSRYLKFYAQRLSAELLPQERVCTCLRRTIPGKTTVDVIRKAGRLAPSYRNLMTCGSVWTCPVCAGRITEERRKELTDALNNTRLTPVLFTYTFQHHAAMRLNASLSGMLEAFRAYKSGRQWQGIQSTFGFAGSVRALEVTHGQNGWHPHLHELMFLERPLDAISEAQLWAILSERWERVLHGQYLPALRDVAFDLERSDKRIGDYIAKGSKWGLEHELAKAPVKKGRRGGRTPFALLEDYGRGDEASGALYIEYAQAFKGRNQLVYSKGLRERLGMGKEKTDAEIVSDEASALDVVLASLTLAEWKMIYYSDNRATLLDVASAGNPDAIEQWLVETGIRTKSK